MASREAVKVVVRCRPMNSKERNENRSSIVQCDTTMGVVALVKPGEPDGDKQFTFDAVYDEASTQRAVYDETGYPLVESVMEGYNGTMFAYGQTGCGKTHTMQGLESPPELRGIIPNSFEHVFENIKIAQDKEFLVRCSYLEIYNEEIRDLLGADPKKKVDLKEDPERGVFVKGLTDVVVDSVNAIDTVMRDGNKNRTVGATLMNAESSRSHSIFTIIIEVNEADEQGQERFRSGKLNLVDLAGSERPSKTGATGARMKEGIKINLSLTALGNVISALVDGKTHIPYRDSKLTRLLQDSLGGNTKTVMMAAISPADYNYEETLSTLRYANRAKNIKNKPMINEDPKDALLRQYKEEIDRLKQLLEAQAAGGGFDLAALAGALGSMTHGMAEHATRQARHSGSAADMGSSRKLAIQDTTPSKTADSSAAAGSGAPAPASARLAAAAHAVAAAPAAGAAPAPAAAQAAAAAAAAPAATAAGGAPVSARAPLAVTPQGVPTPHSDGPSSPAPSDSGDSRSSRASTVAEVPSLPHLAMTNVISVTSPKSARGSGTPRRAPPVPAAGSAVPAPHTAPALMVSRPSGEEDEEDAYEEDFHDDGDEEAMSLAVQRRAEEIARQREEELSRQLQAALEAERNQLGEELERKALEIELERKAREQLAARLESLKSRVIGVHADGKPKPAASADGVVPEEDPEVVLAKQQAQYRKAQLKLKQQKKREAQLVAEQVRVAEEKKMMEEEVKTAQEEMDAKNKSMKKLKSKLSKQLETAARELADTKEEFAREREVLMNTVREQSKENKLLEQLVSLFLTSSEMGKVWERAVWNEETEEWTLPPVRPRKPYTPVVVKLPSLGGGAVEMVTTPHSDEPQGGAEVVSDGEGEGRKRRKDKEGRKKKSESRNRSRPPSAAENGEAPLTARSTANPTPRGPSPEGGKERKSSRGSHAAVPRPPRSASEEGAEQALEAQAADKAKEKRRRKKEEGESRPGTATGNRVSPVQPAFQLDPLLAGPGIGASASSNGRPGSAARGPQTDVIPEVPLAAAGLGEKQRRPPTAGAGARTQRTTYVSMIERSWSPEGGAMQRPPSRPSAGTGGMGSLL